MYLVDTSVWIDYFRDTDTKATQFFIELMKKNLPFGLTGVIYQEILQAAATKKDFQQLAEYLSTQRFYHPLDKISSYQSAAEVYFNCRKKGITVISTVDCIIAQIAIENDLILLHHDKDYIQIARCLPQLQLYPA